MSPSFDALAGLTGTYLGLPLQYGQLYQGAYGPMYGYLQAQAGNQTSLGNQYINAAGGLGQQQLGAYGGLGQNYVSQMGGLGQNAMNLYGSLAGQQASMYQAELPMQMQQAKFNSIAPALSGILGGMGLGGGGLGPISMNFNRPDVMGGFNSTVNNAVGSLQNANNQVMRGFNDQAQGAWGGLGAAYGQAAKNAQMYDDRFSSTWRQGLATQPAPPAPMGQSAAAAPPHNPYALRPGYTPRPSPATQRATYY